MARALYLTTAIDFANAPPHLGHAYEKIAADVMARWHRMRGDEVFFLTGTDEHGFKMEKLATAEGISPKAFVDRISPLFESTWRALNLSPDRFIRTTDADHVAVVTKAYALLRERGFIERALYEGLYCAGCEEFKNERDLVEGKCPNHDAVPEMHREENDVLRVSKFKAQIRDLLTGENASGQNPDGRRIEVQPELRLSEILNLLEGFPDVSVSRKKVKWGIPVPGDEEQVIYVWIDALLNYLSGLGYVPGAATQTERFERFWADPAATQVQLVGKDITKFHCIIWPAILLGLGLRVPKLVYGHGWVTVGQAKMGKSLGNVVEPNAMVEAFGADAVRYFLMREIPFGRDGSYTPEALKLRVNADLANNLGNALNRTLGMLGKNFEGVVPPRLEAVEGDLVASLAEAKAKALAAMEPQAGAGEPYRIHEALVAIWEHVNATNKYVDTQAPWALAKAGESEKLGGVLYAVLESLRTVAILTSPFVPGLSQKIWAQLGQSGSVLDARWDVDLAWGLLPVGQATLKGEPIFLRLDEELAEAGSKKKG